MVDLKARIEITLPIKTAKHIVEILRRTIPQSAARYEKLIHASHEAFRKAIQESDGNTVTIKPVRGNARQLAVYMGDNFPGPADHPAIAKWHSAANKEDVVDGAYVTQWLKDIGHRDGGNCDCFVCRPGVIESDQLKLERLERGE